MASPQCENGYTKIANELLEAIVRSNLPAAQIRLTIWIIRLTYGFHRKETITNVNALATKIRSSGKYVCECISDLEKKSVITVEWASPLLCNITFNKDFDKWQVFL